MLIVDMCVKRWRFGYMSRWYFLSSSLIIKFIVQLWNILPPDVSCVAWALLSCLFCNKASVSLDFLVLLPPWPTSLQTLQLVLNNDLSAQQSPDARNSVALFSRLAQTLFYPINKIAVPKLRPVSVFVYVCTHVTMSMHACACLLIR